MADEKEKERANPSPEDIFVPSEMPITETEEI